MRNPKRWNIAGSDSAMAEELAGRLKISSVVAQVLLKGLQAPVLRRLLCWSLFWHALDIVWVGVMTLVYLMGAG